MKNKKAILKKPIFKEFCSSFGSKFTYKGEEGYLNKNFDFYPTALLKDIFKHAKNNKQPIVVFDHHSDYSMGCSSIQRKNNGQ